MWQRAEGTDSGGGGGGVQMKVGTVSSGTTIDCGFEPKYIAVLWGNSSAASAFYMCIYDRGWQSSYIAYGASAAKAAFYSLGSTGNCRITAVSSTGFTVSAPVSGYTYGKYFAFTDA